MNILYIAVAFAVIVVLALSVWFLLPETVVCRFIFKYYKRMNITPQAVVKRCTNFSGGKEKYVYQDYNSMSFFYDDIVEIYVPFFGRKIELDVFESYLAEKGKAYIPQEKGISIISV